MRCTLYSENDAFLRKRFLELPKGMYPVERDTQDRKTEEALLKGTHPLSGNFKVYPFLALDENGFGAARCLLTVYPNNDRGYVGFFESVNDPAAARLVLDAAAEKARSHGCSTLVGPYNASFWIGYRFKTSSFQRYFTGEPNNKAYYPRLWESCGFTVTDHYFSNHMRVPTEADAIPKAVKRLERFREDGYDFRTITPKTFDQCLVDIYHLLTELYSSFPGYQPITEQQFVSLFGSLKFVLDHEMVKLVYKNEKLAAFVICVPNYGALVEGTLRLRDLPKIFEIRKAPREYVIPYMGVSPAHAGLGNALSELLRQDLIRKNAASFSALIHDGKVTGGFYKNLKIGQTDYVLMERPL